MSAPVPAVLAEYTRSGFAESVHLGHAVVVGPTGEIVASWGDPGAVIFPRSANKPAQATAMVAEGLDLPAELLALAAASHSGERVHLDGAAAILALAGLDATALRTPADYPLDPVERDAWVCAGRAPEPIGMNCSGKHAAMLLTCVLNGWPTDGYRAPDHPLQVGVRAHLERLSGEEVGHIGIDGCGAPVMALTVAGLARSLSVSVQAPESAPERRVVDAMRAWPERVGGSRRDVTHLMKAVPGLLCKDGAEGVYAAALPDGRAIALKVLDGSERARLVALTAVLAALGVPEGSLAQYRQLPVLGGGAVVGHVCSPLA